MQPAKPGSVLAVAVIEAQKGTTRRQVINLQFEDARRACAVAAWRPAMHYAVQILSEDPKFDRLVAKWAQEWNEGLVYCYRGDMANASGGVAGAFEMKDKMTRAAD